MFPESPEVMADCSLTPRRALSCHMLGPDRLIAQPESAAVTSALLLLHGSLSVPLSASLDDSEAELLPDRPLPEAG